MDATARDPSPELLREFLSYDPETGSLTRIKAANHRHRAAVGQPTGSVNSATGYVEVFVGGAKHYGHRVAWIMANGPIPAGMRVDHANRNRGDNRLCNLRLATHADNLRNCKVRADNTSGVKGVSFDKDRGKWAARVGRRLVGRFTTLPEAAQARADAAAAAFGQFVNETAPA